MIGASAIVSACIGAAVRFAFLRPGGFRQGNLTGRSLSIVETFTNPQTMMFIAVWFGLNLIFGTGVISVPGEEAGIAWQAHMGGLFAGLLLFGWFDRGTL